jgi:hypothetical protein
MVLLFARASKESNAPDPQRLPVVTNVYAHCSTLLDAAPAEPALNFRLTTWVLTGRTG